jgi:hypothetical protein
MKRYISKCVHRHNFPVNNNHAKCYIIFSGLSSSTKLFILSCHMYQFQKYLLNTKYMFSVFLQIIQLKCRCLPEIASLYQGLSERVLIQESEAFTGFEKKSSVVCQQPQNSGITIRLLVGTQGTNRIVIQLVQHINRYKE